VGPDKLYRKIPWDFLRGKTPKFHGMCRYYFLAPPNIFHNFVSFHPILMFLTILESGDKTNNIGDEFKTITHEISLISHKENPTDFFL
jgi:hypothetical protein